MLTARTLAEAQVYVSVTTAGDPDVLAEPPAPIEPGANLVEGEDAWTLTSPVGEISISYASEDAARTLGTPFGLGVSQLIDAAQWAMVATIYARRALTADMAYTGGPGEERAQIEREWEFAEAAVAEAIKFLPEGAAEVPPEGVWSALGRQGLVDNPHLVTRAKLLDDLEYYHGTLSDFRALYGESS